MLICMKKNVDTPQEAQEFKRRFKGHLESMRKWLVNFLKIIFDKLCVETCLYKFLTAYLSKFHSQTH